MRLTDGKAARGKAARGKAADQGGDCADGGGGGSGARAARRPRGGGAAAAGVPKGPPDPPEATDRSVGGGAGPSGTLPTEQAQVDKKAALERQAKRISNILTNFVTNN